MNLFGGIASVVGFRIWEDHHGWITMVGRQRRDIPTPLARGRDRFEGWRRTRKVGARIPDMLWSLAAKLAEGHGLNRTASASVLGLAYYVLKRRVEARNSDSASVSPAFIELSPPPWQPRANVLSSSGRIPGVRTH